ncbi:MAG: pyruvate kinase [Elusimicrobia bacterium]|nr:pyruvate kinase [Elusimicrobiota bacterium]
MMRQSFRFAKIVCTLGPASRSPETIEALVRAGMDAARLNFSHGTHEEHARTIRAVRAVGRKLEKSLAIIADLQGPKIRTGPLAGGKNVELTAGQEFAITSKRVAGGPACVSTTYAPLPREVRRGDRILLSDGLIELKVESVRGSEVRCRVVNGGELGEHKGINLPGVRLSAPSLTAKDREDLAFALEQGAEYVAVSFVRRAADVREARRAARGLGFEAAFISKIEKPEAVLDLDAILAESDGVMAARGDLGVEMSIEKVPVIQKEIIRRGRMARIPVITATQMLESMTRNPRPTRAEASDVANAVFDGTSALMLSEETAVGDWPVETVRMMDRIIREAEASPKRCLSPLDWPFAACEERQRARRPTAAEAVANAALAAAREVDLRCIAVFTESGRSARLISHCRPPCPIIGFSPSRTTRHCLALVWGVRPRRIHEVRDIDDLTETAEKRLLEERLAAKGDVVAIVAGTPLGLKGTTNLMKLHVIGAPTHSRSGR